MYCNLQNEGLEWDHWVSFDFIIFDFSCLFSPNKGQMFPPSWGTLDLWRWNLLLFVLRVAFIDPRSSWLENKTRVTSLHLSTATTGFTPSQTPFRTPVPEFLGHSLASLQLSFSAALSFPLCTWHPSSYSGELFMVSDKCLVLTFHPVIILEWFPLLFLWHFIASCLFLAHLTSKDLKPKKAQSSPSTLHPAAELCWNVCASRSLLGSL